ncbi:MAG: hypothetical protein AB1521_04300 [Bacteroidota bacterium]
MTLTHKRISGVAFIFYGVCSLLSYYSILNISPYTAVGLTFILFGIPSTYLAFKNNRRDLLLLSALIFMIGTILIVKSNYEIINDRGIVFTSILFIGGTLFFILFIDNTRVKGFLFASLILIIMGIIPVTFSKEIGILDYANKAADLAEDFWPVVLIILGLNVFLNRKK